MKPVSGKNLVKLLEARGWQIDRISGSHHICIHSETGNRTTVPVHGN